jgi:nitroimidazol reductase NimA-like FMN-containing flavoprotein (pyridoxamine 5'-phosphate oxidase superfamily)
VYMTTSEQQIHAKISDLLSQQRLAALSTQRDGQPYSSLMAFAATADLKNIVVATSKSTRKHQNIIQESRVSLLIDNRSNSENDFHGAMAATVLGKAQIIEDSERQDYLELYLSKHPYLEKFMASPTTAFFRIKVYHYLLVSRFQNVMEYSIDNEIALFS